MISCKVETRIMWESEGFFDIQKVGRRVPRTLADPTPPACLYSAPRPTQVYDTLYLLPTVSPLGRNDIGGAQQLGCDARFLAWIWSPRKASLDEGPKGPDRTDSFPLRKALLEQILPGLYLGSRWVYSTGQGMGSSPSLQGWAGIASPGCDHGHTDSGAAGTDCRRDQGW